MVKSRRISLGLSEGRATGVKDPKGFAISGSFLYISFFAVCSVSKIPTTDYKGDLR